MYDETNVPGPEYRVRPVVRYVITKFYHPYVDKRFGGGAAIGGGSHVVAEVASEAGADEIAAALRNADQAEVAAMEAAKHD